jgi:HPr kinase/phosphorylase
VDGEPTIHGSAVLCGARAVLIRGPAGSGKSRLAWELMTQQTTGRLPFARLVADDRVLLQTAHGRLLARPPAAIAGLIELRGLGIRRLAFEPVAVVGLVVDLDSADTQRMPDSDHRATEILDIRLPRIQISKGSDALALCLAWYATVDPGF